MEQENKLLPKKITIIDKIKNVFIKMVGYQEGKKFMIDTEPELKKYTDINLMKIASIEEKLKKALNENLKQETLTDGIKENEAESLLEWVVQNAREGLEKTAKKSLKEISLLGYCGLGQGITGFTLQNMGLSPNINNVGTSFGEKAGRHAFLTVNIPIMDEDGKVNDKLYLVDTTYRQFFLRDEVTTSCGEYIKDKKFGNKVAPFAGYWVLKMQNGRAFAEELLEKGFIEFSEENAKIYGDGFVLEEKERKDHTKVPTKRELETKIDGNTYISNVNDLKKHEEIDYDKEELDEWGINIKTPFMQKEEMLASIETIKNIENKDKEQVIEQDKENEK